MCHWIRLTRQSEFLICFLMLGPEQSSPWADWPMFYRSLTHLLFASTMTVLESTVSVLQPRNISWLRRNCLCNLYLRLDRSSQRRDDHPWKSQQLHISAYSILCRSRWNGSCFCPVSHLTALSLAFSVRSAREAACMFLSSSDIVMSDIWLSL